MRAGPCDTRPFVTGPKWSTWWPAPVLWRRAPHPFAGTALSAMAGGAAAMGQPALWSVLLVVVVARQLHGGGRSTLTCMPGAVLLVASTLVAVLTFAGLLGLELLGSSGPARALMVVVAAAAALVTVRRPPARGAHVAAPELLACLPGVVLLLVGGIVTRLPLQEALGPFLAGWDNGAHTLFSAQLTRNGLLSYADEAYPRGLHALVALAVAARGPLQASPEQLRMLLLTQSSASWLMSALLSMTVGLVAVELGRRCRLAPVPTGASAVVAALLAVTPAVFGFTMAYGFATSVALAFVLAVLSLELLHDRRPAVAVVLAAAACTAGAHTYQLVLPVLVLPLAVAAWDLRGGRHERGCWDVLLPAALALAAAPPVVAVIADIGVAGVRIEGQLAELPTALLVAGLCSAAWAASRSRGRAVRLAASMPLVTAGHAVLLAGISGATLGDYYPRKVLWHAAVLSIPALTVSAAALLARTADATRQVPLLRVASPTLAVCLALLVLSSAGGGVLRAATRPMPGQPLAAVLHPEDASAVCSFRSEYGRKVAVRLLHFYDGTIAPPPPQVGELPDCPTTVRKP